MNFFNTIRKFFFKPQDKDLHNFLVNKLNYDPLNLDIFLEVFTHKSLRKYKNNNFFNFERLEFLGDAVLQLVVSNYLFNNLTFNVGNLSKIRSKIVSRNNLNNISLEKKLYKYLKYKGNISNFSEDIHGNLLEALIGGIYLDRGLDVSKKFIFDNILCCIDLVYLSSNYDTYKSYIYELSQKNKFKLTFVTYRDLKIRDKYSFISIIKINDKEFCRSMGQSKKKSEENVSYRAYYILYPD